MIGDIHRHCHLLLQEVPAAFDSCDSCYFQLSEDPFCSRPADLPFCSYPSGDDDTIDIVFFVVGEYE